MIRSIKIFKIFARIEWKDTSKNPQEVKTTPSRNDLDLVKGLGGQALHAPLPRSAGTPTRIPMEAPPDASPSRASPLGQTTPVEGSARGLRRAARGSFRRLKISIKVKTRLFLFLFLFLFLLSRSLGLTSGCVFPGPSRKTPAGRGGGRSGRGGAVLAGVELVTTGSRLQPMRPFKVLLVASRRPKWVHCV